MQTALIVSVIILAILVLVQLIWFIISSSTTSKEIAGQSTGLSLLQQNLEALRVAQDNTSQKLAEAVCDLINQEFDSLPRKEIFESSISKHSHVLVAKDMDRAIDFTNEYATEHLQILTEDPFIMLNKINHAGSIFLGPYAPVPVGDYASGTNHVLPTGQCARMFSGLSVDDFIKKPTFQYLSKEGLSSLKDVVVTLAEAEGLPMHARAVQARFK